MTDILNGLTQVELLELRARATALLEKSSDKTDEGEMHDILADALRGIGEQAPHYGVAKRLPHFSSFLKNASVVSVFVTEHMNSPDKLHRKSAYVIFIKMLLRWMTTCGIPISHRSVCQNLGKIPAIVRRQFPGYIESGLLGHVIMSAEKASAVA